MLISIKLHLNDEIVLFLLYLKNTTEMKIILSLFSVFIYNLTQDLYYSLGNELWFISGNCASALM